MAANDWTTAIDQLQALRQQDPTHQPDLVNQMLFDAYFSQAQALATVGDLPEASAAVNKALELQPEHQAAGDLKRSIDLYLVGAAAMGSDWEAAIAAFSDLFALNPDFQDTHQQLFLAHIGAGDAMRATDPCVAAEHYQTALRLIRDAEAKSKLEDARLDCGPVTPTPALAPTPTSARPLASGPRSGQIAYTFFDDEREFYASRLWDVATNRAGLLIAEQSLQPDVNPKGAIVVRSLAPEQEGVTVYDRPDAQPRRLTKLADDSFPRWSPDGGSVLFVSSNRASDGKPHMFLLDALSRAVDDLGPGQGPAWSPDGRRIVYQGCDAGGKACGLWIRDIAGVDRRQLTSVASDSMPAWSPDGRYIAFMSSGRSPTWDIFVADAETGNVPYFVLDDAQDGLPVWSPDGSGVAFLSDREGEWAVHLWSLADLSVSRLFSVDGDLPSWQEAGLSWSP